MRRLVVLLLLACLAAVGMPAHGKERRQDPERWQGSLSKAIYTGVVRSTHHLQAKDGTSLSLTVHLPAGLKSGTKLPTLLQLTPYRPLDQASGGYAGYEFFVLRGAAYVEADERGTGGSGGCLDFGGSADRSDADVFSRWIRSQSWSNGRIVTDGVSHPGMGSVVAHAAVPGLTGALAHAPVVSYYQDEWLQGAKFEDQFNGPLYQGIELAPPLPPEFADAPSTTSQAAACTGRTTTDFTPVDGPLTPLWKDRDLSRHISQGRSPVLLTHGFLDMNVHPDHSQMYWDALPNSAPKYAIFGWWYHGYPNMKGHPFGTFAKVRHRWMDTLLLRRNNGLFAEPRVLVEDNLGVWHEGANWPLERSQDVALYPGADTLASRAPAAGAVSYKDALGAARGKWEGASAVFRSEEFTANRLVNGAPVLDLLASSTADSTKWVAYLFTEDKTGTRRRVTHGYADSHTWDGESQWKAMQPGKPYRWRLKLQPTAVVVERGSRLVLVVTSQDS
ncbi:MAG TPA: CocE/NonD family hydrolase, partial [Mycobacteriales bacterium]|nr:CocE/NonD family hydrolase [Mycobacteriales bacterium]